MSTQILEMSDAELQELFDHELPCNTIKFCTNEPCPEPGEWIIICKACGLHEFLCAKCKYEAERIIWIDWACIICEAYGAFGDVFRIVGKA